MGLISSNPDKTREHLLCVLARPCMFATDNYGLYAIINTILILCAEDNLDIKFTHWLVQKYRQGNAWRLEEIDTDELADEIKEWLNSEQLL